VAKPTSLFVDQLSPDDSALRKQAALGDKLAAEKRYTGVRDHIMLALADAPAPAPTSKSLSLDSMRRNEPAEGSVDRAGLLTRNMERAAGVPALQIAAAPDGAARGDVGAIRLADAEVMKSGVAGLSITSGTSITAMERKSAITANGGLLRSTVTPQEANDATLGRGLAYSKTAPTNVAGAGEPLSKGINTYQLAAPAEPAGAATALAPTPRPAAKAMSLGGAIATEPTIANPVPAPTVALGVTQNQLATANRQRFVQADSRAQLRRNFNSPAPAPVLESFQFENTGNNVRITDADGSVYTGDIIGVAPQQPAGSKLESDSKLKSGSAVQFGLESEALKDKKGAGQVLSELQEQSQNVRFRVQGLNRSLNQNVDFDGTLVIAPDTNKSQLGATPAQQLPTQADLQRGQIQGRAVIGNRTQVEIRAAPTTPNP
jgi:hypothetical protein